MLRKMFLTSRNIRRHFLEEELPRTTWPFGSIVPQHWTKPTFSARKLLIWDISVLWYMYYIPEPTVKGEVCPHLWKKLDSRQIPCYYSFESVKSLFFLLPCSELTSICGSQFNSSHGMVKNSLYVDSPGWKKLTTHTVLVCQFSFLLHSFLIAPRKGTRS